MRNVRNIISINGFMFVALFCADAIYADSISPSTDAGAWRGPTSGPAAQPGKKVVYLAEDLRNGGVLGVAQGVKEAAAKVGWTIEILDAKGTDDGRRTIVQQALAQKPDGLIIGGMDAKVLVRQMPNLATTSLPTVAWHAGESPGPISGTPVVINVTTEPSLVARAAAQAAITQSNGKAGVVIFTDSNFAIAMKKANAMAEVIKACAGCKLLEIRDIAISRSAVDTPKQVAEMLKRYGNSWTYSLAINDIYFDHATPVFSAAGLPASGAMSCISAGDGSATAYMRIMAGTFQTGTVPEPLNLQGWQLVDELNRRFAGRPVSDYVESVHVVTPNNVMQDGGTRSIYDPDNGYRQAYARIWQRR